MTQVLSFTFDDVKFVVSLANVQAVFRSAAFIDLPPGPDYCEGLLNVHGEILPVIDVRRKLNFPSKPMSLSDSLIAVKTSVRAFIFRCDQVVGIEEIDFVVPCSDLVVGFEKIKGVARLHDGVLFLADCEAFLSQIESDALDEYIRR